MIELKEIIIDNEEDELLFFERYNFEIYHRILEGVKIVFDKKIDVLEIVKIVNKNSGNTMIISVEKENWKNHLESCLKFLNQLRNLKFVKKS